MHPDHVAELVAEQTQALKKRLARSDFPVQAVELREGTDLLVRFISETTRSFKVSPGIPGTFEVPIIGTSASEEVVLEFRCEDYDSQPPLVLLLDAEENPLSPERWPHDQSELGIVNGHPDPEIGERKFFCREGTREFHSHPHHEDSPWDRTRESMTIDGLAIGILHDFRERWKIRVLDS